MALIEIDGSPSYKMVIFYSYVSVPEGIYIYIYLVGGDWNHGILNDFPETVGNVIISIDELIFFRGVETTNHIYYIYVRESYHIKYKTNKTIPKYEVIIHQV